MTGELELPRIVETLMAEGCVGETLAALQAGEAARLCQDPVVKKVLEGITADETRHAALAWKALRWLVERHPELRQVARKALVAATRPAVTRTGRDDLEAHGMLSPATQARVHEVGRREVVATLAAQVLGSGRDAGHAPRMLEA
jgi:hypothetical protein